MNLAALGEFGLISRLARSLGAVPSRAGTVDLAIGDDAALLGIPAGERLVATTDALAEGVHFRRDWSAPADLGWKALAVNVSDLGAMGARPVAALITIALPRDTPVSWIDCFYAGLRECAERYGSPVVGGDTVRSLSGIHLSITALGVVRAECAARRSGAGMGDLLCVTGTLGASGAGLALLEAGGRPTPAERAAVIRPHLRPEPPVEAGALLAEAGLATAMMDLSDGLSSDLRRLAAASGVGVRIKADRLPISDATRRVGRKLGVDPTEWALSGGEDYELLFTVRPDRFAEAAALLAPIGETATIIGRITRRGLRMETDEGSVPLRPPGFEHFPAADPSTLPDR